MKTRSIVCCTGVLLVSRLGRFRHKARLLAAALFLFFITAISTVSAQTVSNCVTVICPPQFMTNYTCAEIYVPQQYPVIVSNICPGIQVQMNCNPPPGTPLGLGAHPIQCAVIANGQIVGRCDFTLVVVRDTTPPTIRCPSNIVVSTCQGPTGGCGAIVMYPPPVASDNSGDFAVTCTPPSGSMFPCTTTTVTCSVEDRCGLKDACTFNVTVNPQGQPPTIQCPSNIVVNTCSNGARVSFSATAMPAGTAVFCTPASGSLFPVGVSPVTCVASNGCGTVQCGFNVEVRPIPRVTIQCPQEPFFFTAPCGSNCLPVVYPAPVVNNGKLESCNPPSGSCLPVGTHTIVCRATNECDTVFCVFDVFIQQGQGQPPGITCPSNIVVDTCQPNCQAVNYPSPAVVNGTLSGCNPPPTFCFPLGVTTVTCRATNNCGTNQCTFTITVRPLPPPTITCPTNRVVTLPCGSNCVPVQFPAPVINNGALESCNPPSGFCFPAGLTPVTCRATNNCGASLCTFEVRVIPGQGPLPTLDCPTNPIVRIITLCVSNCAPVSYPLPPVTGGTLIGCNPPPGFCFPLGDTPVTCVASNNCGTNSCAFIVRVFHGDPFPPSIQCPSNIVVTAPCGSNCVPVTYAPIVNNGTLAGCAPPSGTCFQIGVTPVVCRATNDCGMLAQCQFDVRVNPGTVALPPTIQCPNDVVTNAPCGSNCVRVVYPLPTVGNGSLAGCVPPRGTCFPVGITPVICRATNNCGQTVECQFNVRVNSGQGQPPIIQCATSNVLAILPCGSNCVPVFYPTPVVINGGLVSCNPPPGTCLPLGIHPVTCIASNDCGQSSTCSFNVEVRQNTTQPPTIQCPSNVVLRIPCGSNCVPISYPLPIVGNGVLLGCDPPPGTCLPAGIYPVVCRASNACARVECEFLLRLIPSEGQPPTIQCPTNRVVVNLPCNTNCAPIAYPIPGVGNGALAGCNPPPGTCLPLGIYNVICRATNDCGEARCEFTLEVRPGANAPTINCPTNTFFVQLPCISNCVPVNYPLPTVNNGVLVDCTPPPGTCLPVGLYPVVCRATNNCGEVRCTFLVRVIPVGDPIPPSIQCPTNMIVTAPCGSNCVPVIYPLPIVNNGTFAGCSPPSGSCLPIGITTVYCRATNGCDMVAECKFDVRVVPGQGQEPSIRCPTNFTVTLPCNSNCVPVNYPLPTVTNGVFIACNPPPGTCLPAGNHLITCFASNDCARASCEFIVTVIRQNAPLAIRCPSNIVVTLPCGSNCVPVIYPPPSVTNGVLVGCNPPSGTCFPAGLFPIVCRATNSCGEEIRCEFQIRVIRGQGQGPNIQCPTNIVVTAPCGSNCVPVLYPAPIVGNGVLESCNPPPGTCFPVGSITTVTCRATNNCGATLCTFTVRVVPSTGGPGPTIQCPTNVIVATVPCGTNCVPINYPPPIVNNGALVACNPPPGTCLSVGIYPVTCVASNNCGQVQCQFEVRVINGTGHPPIINCPSNITVESCSPNCEPVNYPLPTVFNGSLRGCTPPPGFCFPPGQTPVVCVATNQCGMTNTCTFIVTVRPVPFPTIRCPSNIVVTTCGTGEIVNYPPPTVSPGASNVVCTPPSGSFFPVGTHTVRCCVVDRCNRTNCCEFLVIVRPSDPCVKPPPSMVLWLPFDEPVGPIAHNIIPGAPNGGHINGPVPLVGQYVLNSLGFDGINDFVRVPNYGMIVLSLSDFSIDAWVFRAPGAAGQGRQVIVSKVMPIPGVPGPRGYEYYLNNGVMNLFLGGIASHNFNSGVAVPLDNNWHHVAVTVDRAANGGVRFYLDGVLVNAQAGPIPQPLGNGSSLFVGASTLGGPNSFFRGHIDEVEIFRRALSPAEILALWNAQRAGKCKVSCTVRHTVPIPPGTCVTVNARICNSAGVPQTIHWVASGPSVIPPQSGAVTLSPFTCTIVPVTLCSPPTVPPNGQSIWTFSVAAESQCPTVCTGVVVDPGNVGITVPDNPTGIPGNSMGGVNLGLDGLPADAAVRFRVMDHDMQVDMEHVSLNGLPPGMPWVLDGATKAKRAKAAEDGTFNLPVQFMESDPGGVYSIVIEVDLNGDGTFEPLASFDVENFAVSPPTIRIENGQLWWDDMGDGLGGIESADSLEGPWTPVPGGPGTPIDSSGGLKFYRIAVPAVQ